jgi:hypothetical protein
MNAHAREELLDVSFSIRSMPYQWKQAISSSQNFLLKTCHILHQHSFCTDFWIQAENNSIHGGILKFCIIAEYAWKSSGRDKCYSR